MPHSSETIPQANTAEPLPQVAHPQALPNEAFPDLTVQPRRAIAEESIAAGLPPVPEDYTPRHAVKHGEYSKQQARNAGHAIINSLHGARAATGNFFKEEFEADKQVFRETVSQVTTAVESGKSRSGAFRTFLRESGAKALDKKEGILARAKNRVMDSRAYEAVKPVGRAVKLGAVIVEGTTLIAAEKVANSRAANFAQSQGSRIANVFDKAGTYRDEFLAKRAEAKSVKQRDKFERREAKKSMSLTAAAQKSGRLVTRAAGVPPQAEVTKAA